MTWLSNMNQRELIMTRHMYQATVHLHQKWETHNEQLSDEQLSCGMQLRSAFSEVYVVIT
jgi:hypothetical protein